MSSQPRIERIEPKFTKICEIGTIKIGRRYATIFIKITYKDKKLSISGVEGPLQSGNAVGSCGQIDMSFEHENQMQNDSRYDNLISPSEINFKNDWDKNQWFRLLDIWYRYHLNDMKAGCKHQERLKETLKPHLKNNFFSASNYSTIISISEFYKCSSDGYRYGTSWNFSLVPIDTLEFLQSLPDSKRKANWV